MPAIMPSSQNEIRESKEMRLRFRADPFTRLGIGSVNSSFSGPVVVLTLVAAIVGFLLLV
jgi:hypothetical protein